MVVWSEHNEIINFSVYECQKLSCVLAIMLYSPFPTINCTGLYLGLVGDTLLIFK